MLIKLLIKNIAGFFGLGAELACMVPVRDSCTRVLGCAVFALELSGWWLLLQCKAGTGKVRKSPLLNIKPVACFLCGVKIPVARSWWIICLLKHETGSHRSTRDLMSNFTNANECRNAVFFWVQLWAGFGCLLHQKCTCRGLMQI